ncbi:hypothetical protein Lalb_Chr20g0114561 [Lupinus albus]|uniref:Uncharacterized protein n=1 Tax=Lupinus albus TaxID=3870 RepID=A0A6A4NX49_LUPAL|nr:hypothetical protein Lalb_Chr20g0114561 [Lupinus albus]
MDHNFAVVDLVCCCRCLQHKPQDDHQFLAQAEKDKHHFNGQVRCKCHILLPLVVSVDLWLIE